MFFISVPSGIKILVHLTKRQRQVFKQPHKRKSFTNEDGCACRQVRILSL